MAKLPSFQMESSLDEKQKARIYHLKGKLIGSVDCYDFLELARSNITEETPHVVLLMSGLTMINSTGIGIVAALLTSTRKCEGKLCLIGASDTARRQFEITHLWSFLDCAEDLDHLSL
jgi:anti-anti-sigma factor